MHIAPRCALCQFDIDVTDKLAILEIEKRSAPCAGPSPPELIVCSDIDCPEDHHDACHAYCQQIVEPVCLQALLPVTRYSHTAAESEERRRRLWLRARLRVELEAYYAPCEMRNLSSDLWYYVADYLLPYYAVLRVRGVLPNASGVSINSITITEKMWYGVTDYEGTTYVSWLSSSPEDHGSLPLAFHADYTPECLLVAENYLGITDVRLANFDEFNAIGESPGTWWRAFPLDCVGMKIELETDGIKLRRLVCGNLGAIAWSVPEPKRPRFHYFCDISSPRVPARMASFLSNHPKATGYSFLWDCDLVHIHTHMTDENMAFYRSFSPGSWLYMAIDSGEFITEIWQQKALYPRERAIAFVTNKGRIFIAGVYLKIQRPFTLIERPSQKLSRIHFETSANGIGALAFETDAPKIQNSAFIKPQPSPNDIFLPIENYFFSSHSLDRLEEVTPCLAKGGTGVTGLILHFPDGHRGSVGQIRLDSLGDRFTITESPLWFLTFGKRQGGYPYVLKVGTCRPEEGGDIQHVMELSCRGKLEWIWSNRQCLVICNGHKSPPTML